MGVIDLDARVKKLEKDGTGGAVIDQLEAAVTSLEETVNGNGETDLGLVGDVAALQTDTSVVDESAKFTVNNALTIDEASPGVSIMRVGNVVYFYCQFSITAGASTAGTDTVLGTIDTSIRPQFNISTIALGETESVRTAFIGSNGDVKSKGGNWTRFEAFWVLPTT